MASGNRRLRAAGDHSPRVFAAHFPIPLLQWRRVMQVLQAGQHKLIYLELQPQMVAKIARDAGFETRAKDGQRHIQLDLSAPAREAPLLLFDAADPANLGW